MKIDLIIAKNVDALMTKFSELGSQVLLSRKTGVATSTVGRIRRGEVSPTAESIDAIARAFGVEPGDLFDENLIFRLNLPTSSIGRIDRIVSKIRSGKLDDRQIKVIEATLEIE